MAAAALATVASCAPLMAPGMAESSVPLSLDAGTASNLVVAFPASACTGAESAVFVDEKGRFIGSVAPGTSAALAVPPDAMRVFVVGNSDVVAPPRTWFVRHEISRRSDQGVIVVVDRADGHNCVGKWSGPLLPRPEAATIAAVTEAAQGLRPLVSKPVEGNHWLDENRERVNELVGRVQAGAPVLEPVMTQTLEAN